MLTVPIEPGDQIAHHIDAPNDGGGALLASAGRMLAAQRDRFDEGARGLRAVPRAARATAARRRRALTAAELTQITPEDVRASRPFSARADPP